MATHSLSTSPGSSKGLHIILWLAQILLGAMFLMAGFMKSTQPIEQLSVMLPWAGQIPAALVRFIGISELLGGLGLLLPSLLRIQPQLTVWAAIGLSTIMGLALVFHLYQGEASVIGINLVLGLVAGFIAWGRSRKAPIRPKS